MRIRWVELASRIISSSDLVRAVAEPPHLGTAYSLLTHLQSIITELVPFSYALKSGINRAVVGDFDLGVILLQGADGAGVRELVSIGDADADPGFDGRDVVDKFVGA